MFKIALRNIFRNKRRTILTGLSIVFSVMIVIYLWSLINGVMDDVFENAIRLTSGHLRIVNTDYLRRERMLPLEANIDKSQKIIQTLKTNKRVTHIQKRLKFGVLLEYKGKNQPVIGVGIQPDKEEPISHLSKKIIKGRKVKSGYEEINIGNKLAAELNLKVGDELTLVTQTAYGSIAAMNLKIVGIFSFGIPSIDHKFFYMPLDKAQELLDLEGKVTEIFVLVKNKEEIDLIASQVGKDLNKTQKGAYSIKTWKDQGMIYVWMKMAKSVYGTLCIIILVLGSFTIFNTMFMSVLEQTKEIGMMKAMGMKNKQLLQLVLTEAMFIGLMASFIGALCGAGIAYYLATEGIDFTAIFDKIGGDYNLPLSYIYRAVFRWQYIITGFLFGVLVSVLAAVPPGLRAAKMNPAETLREI
ncbi:ABC transporter permease [Candidatus Margulisiibacteriota bacterium]